MNRFQQAKEDTLSRPDKSSIGKWDKHIQELCNKINSSKNYYTTSSCSGRIIIMKDEEKKAPNLFKFVSHELVEFKKFFAELRKLKGNLKFKQESPILHISCRTLKDAEIILKKCQSTGWKISGIISLGKKIIVEALSTEKIEFPIISCGKLLVEENFLKIVLEKANLNLKKAWLRIKKLKEIL